MDDEVDPSFYISQEKVGRFITDKNTLDAVLYDSCQVKRELKSREYNDYSQTLSARDYKDPRIINDSRKDDTATPVNLRIRKLTPKECFRLMGFSDEDFLKAQSVNSNSQLYKQAGNSIVVDVLYYIFSELYKVMPYLFDNLRVGSYFSGIGAFEKALDRLFSDGVVSENFNFPTNMRGGGKPVLVGGIGSKNFGNQYRQGNRVYHSKGIAVCLTASPLGNTGGYSYLYIVKE